MEIFKGKQKRDKGRLKSSMRLSEEMALAILDNITDGILLLSKNFRVLWANKGIMELTHLKEDEIIGDFCYKVTHHRDEPCQGPYDVCPVEEILKTGRAMHVIHTHFDKDGNEIYMEVSAYPIKNEQGEVAQFVHIARDVTDQIKAEMALKKKIKELSQFKELTVDREIRMVELKKEINRLSRELGRQAPYDVAGESERKKGD